MAYPRPGRFGGTGSGATGPIDPARLTNVPASAIRGDIAAARLPALRRRYARYDVATPVVIVTAGGDFNAPLNINHLTFNDGAATTSILDRWSGNNHPFNVQGNYIDRSQFAENEICEIQLEFSNTTHRFISFDFRIRWVNPSGTDLGITDLSIVPLALNASDVAPIGSNIDRVFSSIVMSDEISNPAARGLIEFVTSIDQDASDGATLQSMTILGGVIYDD